MSCWCCEVKPGKAAIFESDCAALEVQQVFALEDTKVFIQVAKSKLQICDLKKGETANTKVVLDSGAKFSVVGGSANIIGTMHRMGIHEDEFVDPMERMFWNKKKGGEEDSEEMSDDSEGEEIEGEDSDDSDDMEALMQDSEDDEEEDSEDDEEEMEVEKVAEPVEAKGTVSDIINQALAKETKKEEPAKPAVAKETKKVEVAKPTETKKVEPVAEIKKVEPVAEIKKVEPVAETKKVEPVAEAKKVEPVAAAKKVEPVAAAKNVEPVTESAKQLVKRDLEKKVEAAESPAKKAKTSEAPATTTKDAVDESTLSKKDKQKLRKQKLKAKKREANSEAKEESDIDEETRAKRAIKAQKKLEKKSAETVLRTLNLKYGVVAEVLKNGRQTAKPGARLDVTYVGKLPDGTVYEEDRVQFKLGLGAAIECWEIGLKGMKIGEFRRLRVPARLAFGAEGMKGNKAEVPPNTDVVFDVTLHGTV